MKGGTIAFARCRGFDQFLRIDKQKSRTKQKYIKNKKIIKIKLKIKMCHVIIIYNYPLFYHAQGDSENVG